MLNNKHATRSAIIVSACAFCLFSQQLNAAAFAIKEQSVTYLGNAFSGTASSCIDASTNFYNPAGLTELNNVEVVASATYLHSRVKLYNARATSNISSLPVTGANNPSYPSGTALIPGMHAAWRVNEKFALGFSIAAPFGLSTKYHANDIARYMATTSKLETVDLSPGVSYRINNKFSLGAALDVLYVKATIASDTRFATFGFLSNQASGWTAGYRLGVLFKPSESTSMGLAYFSRFAPRVSGDVQSANFPGPARRTVSANVKLPDKIVYSITHKYTDQWKVMGDIEWTHWSVFKYLRLNYNTGANTIEYFYYKNAFRFALGTDYKHSESWTFKGGLSYEQTPVTDTWRSARLPDSNRYWLALGLKYFYNKHVNLDVGYAHVFFKNAPIAQTGAVTRTLFGNYRSSADLIGVQLTWNFV